MAARVDAPTWSHSALPERRRLDHRALCIVLVLHLLLILAFVLVRDRPRVAPNLARRETIVVLKQAAPPVTKQQKPAAAGVKLAARASVGLPTKRSLESALTMLPQLDLALAPPQTAVTDPLPNLASIDIAPSSAGTGGTGVQGVGAGAAGAGKGGGGLFADCADTPERAMVASLVRLPQDTKSLERLAAGRPVKTVCMAQLDITPRPFRQGFPGVDRLTEWFGLDIRFTVDIAEAGPRDIMLIADDGAILSIDDVEVVNNDGLHEARPSKARVNLAAGLRRFRVRYFQGPGDALALMLAWKRPGDAEFDYIPAKLIGRPAI